MGLQPGDIIFARTAGLLGLLIRLGERLKFRRGSAWNHACVIDRIDGETPYVIQATLRGVTDSMELWDVAKGGKWHVVSLPAGVDREKLLEFQRAQLGTRYGFFTILAIAMDILTWQWFPAFRGARRDSWICSALVCEGLRYAGWYHPWLDVYTVTPAQAWNALQS